MMRSRFAGTALRQLGPVLFASAPAARAAAEPAYALLAGAPAAATAPTHAGLWLVRFSGVSRAASSLSGPVAVGGEAAAKKDEGATKKVEWETDQKAVVSYWGVPPSRVTKEDGTPWRWACFRVRTTQVTTVFSRAKHRSAMGDVRGRPVDRSEEAPRSHHVPRLGGLLDGEGPPLAHRHLLPEAVRLPGDDAGDGGGGAGDGGRDAAPPQVAAPVRAERRVDQGAPGGGGERADASDDLHGGVAAAVVRAGTGAGGAGRLLQRLLRRVPALPQVRPPGGGLPGGGGHPLLHRVPQGDREGQHRERARPRHCAGLLAAAAGLHPARRRHGRPRRRGPPPRRQPLRLGCPLPGASAEGVAGAGRVPLSTYLDVGCG